MKAQQCHELISLHLEGPGHLRSEKEDQKGTHRVPSGTSGAALEGASGGGGLEVWSLMKCGVLQSSLVSGNAGTVCGNAAQWCNRVRAQSESF